MDKVKIARQFKRQIAVLEKQQEKLYYQAIRKLKIKDTLEAFDWFYNDQVGFNSFEESLKCENAFMMSVSRQM